MFTLRERSPAPRVPSGFWVSLLGTVAIGAVVVAGFAAPVQAIDVVVPLAKVLSDLESVDPTRRDGAVGLLTDVLNEGPWPAADLAANEPAAISAAARRLVALLPLQEARRPTCTSAWNLADDYIDAAFELELLLDLLSVGVSPASDQLLVDSLGLRDNQLRYFSVLSLAARNPAAIPVGVWGDLANDDRYRARSFARAPDLLRANAPAALLTQDQLARSDLVSYLSLPDNVGCTPDRIARTAVVDRTDGRYYVFRFEPQAGRGAYAGISGPFPKRGPARAFGSRTYSDGIPYGSASPRRHLARLLAAQDEIG